MNALTLVLADTTITINVVTDGETFSIQRGTSNIELHSILGPERARLAKFLVEQCRATKENGETFEFMTHENDLRVAILDHRDSDADDAEKFLVAILGSSGKLGFSEESYLGGRFWLTTSQVDSLCSLLLA